MKLQLTAILLGGAALAATAIAQPTGGAGAGGRGAARQACAADLQKLCPDAKPGPGGGMRECVRSHFQDLSEGCKSAIQQMRQMRAGGAGGGPAPMSSP